MQFFLLVLSAGIIIHTLAVVINNCTSTSEDNTNYHEQWSQTYEWCIKNSNHLSFAELEIYCGKCANNVIEKNKK